MTEKKGYSYKIIIASSAKMTLFSFVVSLLAYWKNKSLEACFYVFIFLFSFVILNMCRMLVNEYNIRQRIDKE